MDDTHESIDKKLNQVLATQKTHTYSLNFIGILVLTTMINPIGHLLIQTFSGRPRRSTGSNEDS